MSYPDHVLARAAWGGRPDTVEHEALNTWQWWERLASYGSFMKTPWRSLGLKPYQRIPVVGYDELLTHVTRSYNDGNESNGYTQIRSHTGANESEPCLTMSVNSGAQWGGPSFSANRVMLTMDSDFNDHTVDPKNVEWILHHGIGLVKDLVDIWKPDAASLDSLDLLRLKPESGSSTPVVGFVSWFSSAIADPDRLPSAPVRFSYHNGTVLGIDLSTKDPVGDATALAEPLYKSGILKRIPNVQGQPDPPVG